MARLTVISPDVLTHCLAHPARGHAWKIRELAATVGVARSTIGNLASGRTRTIDATLAKRIADSVGVHPAVLFMTGVSTDSNNDEAVA